MTAKPMFMPAPDRRRYDALMTWATSVLARQDAETINDMQLELFRRGKDASDGDDSESKLFTVFAQLGFAAVVDNMLDQINNAPEES